MNEKRMKDALEAIARRGVPEDLNLMPSIAARLEGRTLMTTLRARPILLILTILLALTLLTGVAYAIGRLTGFVPGFGFAAGDVFVLDEPVEASADEMTVKVEKAVHDESRFWVEVSVRGLPSGEDFSRALLLLPNGEKVPFEMGGSIDLNVDEARVTYAFPPLEGKPREVTLLIENLGGKDFALSLVLRPIQMGEILPVPSTGFLSLQSETHGGLTLVLENVAYDRDKTVLQVSLRFADDNLLLNGPWSVSLQGADGRRYPLIDVTPEILASSGRTKVYETVPFDGTEQLVLSLTAFPDAENFPMMLAVPPNEAGFLFDPGKSPQTGQTWAMDETLQAGGYGLHVERAWLKTANELLFEFSTNDDVTGVMLYAPYASGASGGIPSEGGKFTAGMTFEKLPSEPFMVSVTSIYYTAHGVWEIRWQPSAAPMQAAGLPTSTPLPAAAPYATPTFAASDPLTLEVQALAQKFDASLRQGPGWVHVIWENITENIQPGQTYPPPYYLDEQWYEIDRDGWVLRNLTTHRGANGEVLQQAVTVGSYSVNFTTGDTFTDVLRYRFSLDMLTQDLANAGLYNTTALSEETQCDDGTPCLLITLMDSVFGRRVWINLQTGQQVQYQSFRILPDRQEQVDFTQRILLAEWVASPSQDVLDLLNSVVVPKP